jgi:hypothetical protein
MSWGHVVGAFFAGMFLANGLPHSLHGISGDAFPTPFAKPPGKGLSPALVNVAWGLFNFAIVVVLWHLSHLRATLEGRIAFATGFVVMGLWMAKIFEKRMRV